MNPWEATSDASSGAPFRVSLGGVKAFSARHRFNEKSGLCVTTSDYSSVQVMDKLERLVHLKTTVLERVRELERAEALVSSADVTLSQQLEFKLKAVQAVHGDLEELLAMKSVLLRTLQRNVASEYLDLEMGHQRAFIDLFLRLTDELPRYASSAVATSTSGSSITLTQEVRRQYKDYDAAISQCKATIAKFHLIRDDMARVRAAYSRLNQTTLE